MTRNGEPEAVLLSVDDLEGLEMTLEILGDSESSARISESLSALGRGAAGADLATRRAVRDSFPACGAAGVLSSTARIGSRRGHRVLRQRSCSQSPPCGKPFSVHSPGVMAPNEAPTGLCIGSTTPVWWMSMNASRNSDGHRRLRDRSAWSRLR
ncbi:type II toxin-antitoxin system Phd/YefM family antitoxin [Actinokineospora sp. 24-640]